MLENYLYSIPKKKKIFYAFLISWAFVSLLTYRVNCGGFFSWIASTVTDNITDEIFTAMNQSLGEAVGALIDWFFNTLLQPFGPQIKTFTDSTNFVSVSLTDFLDRFSIFTGMFLATLFFGFGICVYFLNGKVIDSKDTPISLFFRYCVAIAICYKHKTIYTTILTIIDDYFGTMAYTLTKDAMKQEGFLNIVAKSADDELTIFAVKQAVKFTFPGVGLIIVILQIILIWKLIKGFLKLYCEMVSRYIVTMVLLLLFAAFGGTIVSNNTSPIFKSYLRTLFSSFLVMIFNMVWFKGCFFAVLGGNTFTFIQYIFVLELLAFGLKFDGMLRSMGLGVATGGSRIGSAIAGAGRNLANSLRQANAARKGAGNLMQAEGLRTGNKKLFDAGKMLSAGASDIAKGVGLTDPSHMAAQLGAMGKKINDDFVTPEQAGKMLANALTNPQDRDAQNAVRALSKNKLKQGAQALADQGNSGIKVNSASMNQFRGADGKMHSGIAINGEKTKIGKDGKAVSQGVKGTISDADAFSYCQNFGNGMGFQAKGAMKNGERCNASEAAERAGQDVADAMKKASENNPNYSNDDVIQKAGTDINKNDVFNCCDPNGKQYGTVVGGDFTPASDINAPIHGDDMRLAEAKEEIGAASGAGASNVSDFKATGYTATATSQNVESSPVSVAMSPNSDGSSTATLTGADGKSASFNVPNGSSLEDALSTDSGKNAVSSIGCSGGLSDISPKSYSASTISPDSMHPISASVVSNSDGSSTATLTNGNGASSSFDIPKGSSFGEALGSEEGQSALSSVCGGTGVAEFTPTAYSATAGDSDSVQSISATFADNGDGSYTGTLESESGGSVQFNVPSGLSFEDALASDEIMDAASSISGGAEVSGFTPSEYGAWAVDADASGTPITFSMGTDENGNTVGTFSNADGDSSSFYVPNGTGYEDAISSEAGQEAVSSLVDGGYTTPFTPSEYEATGTAVEEVSSPITASFTPGEEAGSYVGTVSNASGDSVAFNVPEGTTFEDALASDEIKDAASSLSGGADVGDFTPSEYTATAKISDDESRDYAVSFSGNNDGTYTASIRDSDGNVSTYESTDETIGNSIRDSLTTSERFDSVSPFEPVEGSVGVYHATGTKDGVETDITATDRGIYGTSTTNGEAGSYMYIGSDSYGNTTRYDVNVGGRGGSSGRQYGSNTTVDAEVLIEQGNNERQDVETADS